jgi:hypothetical protein
VFKESDLLWYQKRVEHLSSETLNVELIIT